MNENEQRPKTLFLITEKLEAFITINVNVYFLEQVHGPMWILSEEQPGKVKHLVTEHSVIL